MKQKYKVSGISCTTCAKSINKIVSSSSPHVKTKVDINTGTIHLDNLQSEQEFLLLKKLITNGGYKEITSTSNREANKFKIDVTLSIIASVPLLLGMFVHLHLFPIPGGQVFVNPYLQLFLATFIQFYIGFRYYKGMYLGLKKGVTGMDFLVSFSSSTAYLYSLYLIIAGRSEVLYFEVSALIITIVLVGKYLEHRVKDKTSDELKKLVDLSPKVARLESGKEVPTEDLKIDDIIIVLANEKIPTDGVIISGESHFDESSFTGESIPVAKETGDEVLGGAVNLSSKVSIRISKSPNNSLLNQIISQVEEASLVETKYQRLADTVSSYFVPIVISLAILTFLIMWFVIGDHKAAFERAIAVVIISCPCALGLATPTSIMVSSGISAREGLLYRGGTFFELANQLNTLAFDKTGTITKGEPEVTYFNIPEIEKNALKSIEKESVHPISKAIINYLDGIESTLDFKVSNIKGIGVQGTRGGDIYHIGNAKIIEKLIITNNPLEDKFNELLTSGLTLNYFIKNDMVLGIYGVKDTIKDDAKITIKHLKDAGITPIMITGDNEIVAREVAREVGIDKFYANTLPQDKANIIKELQDGEHLVGFVGDGINDAVALKQADIGISVMHGSDIALESSDVSLLKDNLDLIITGIEISKATRKNIISNFIWAFSYNVVAIPLAATGNLNMVVAAVTMGFSSVVVVLNSLRLRKLSFSESRTKRVFYTYTITGMSCNKCKAKVEEALRENNILDFDLDLTSGRLVVYQETDKDIKKLVRTLDFEIN